MGVCFRVSVCRHTVLFRFSFSSHRLLFCISVLRSFLINRHEHLPRCISVRSCILLFPLIKQLNSWSSSIGGRVWLLMWTTGVRPAWCVLLLTRGGLAIQGSPGQTHRGVPGSLCRSTISSPFNLQGCIPTRNTSVHTTARVLANQINLCGVPNCFKSVFFLFLSEQAGDSCPLDHRGQESDGTNLHLVRTVSRA